MPYQLFIFLNINLPWLTLSRMRTLGGNLRLEGDHFSEGGTLAGKHHEAQGHYVRETDSISKGGLPLKNDLHTESMRAARRGYGTPGFSVRRKWATTTSKHKSRKEHPVVQPALWVGLQTQLCRVAHSQAGEILSSGKSWDWCLESNVLQILSQKWHPNGVSPVITIKARV